MCCVVYKFRPLREEPSAMGSRTVKIRQLTNHQYSTLAFSNSWSTTLFSSPTSSSAESYVASV